MLVYIMSVNMHFSIRNVTLKIILYYSHVRISNWHHHQRRESVSLTYQHGSNVKNE